MTTAHAENDRSAFSGVWPLYGAAFAMALGLSALWTVMPFIVRNIGGTEEHAGYAWAANMLGYMLCLLFAARHGSLAHLNPRRVTRAAAATMFLATVAMILVVHYVITHNQPGRVIFVWALILAGALAGAAMSGYWPFLMSWVAADYDGAVLNRRLGTYNGMWSSAAIIGPLIGGLLVDMNSLAPIVLCAACLAVSFVLLCLAHDGSAGAASSLIAPNAMQSCPDRTGLSRLRWMARITLFCCWVCLGVCRSQFPLLFADIGFTETQFGMLVTLFGVFNFLIMTGAGRAEFWHFKPMILPGLHVVLILPLLLILIGCTLRAFVPAFVIMGLGFGFAYSAHLYYGACGSSKRSAPMITHEITLSLGIVFGAGAGGYLARNVGIYWPYWFSIVTLIAGLLAEGIIWLARKTRQSWQPE